MTLNISERAKGFLNIHPHSDNSLINWRATCAGDKILTLHYPFSGDDQLRTIISESLATLFEKKSLNTAFALTFREWESFLRDYNHRPALEDPSANDFPATLEQRFMTEKMRLLASVLVTMLKTHAEQMPYAYTSLVEKNRLALWLTEKSSSFIPLDRRWEIALYEAETLYLRNTGKAWQESELVIFLQEIWTQLQLPLPLKVVAVSA